MAARRTLELPGAAMLLAVLAAGDAAALGRTPAGPACEVQPWPLWEAYVEAFIAEDGRVIDPTGGGRSTSEGQAYAMFHALVAGDRATFERALSWADAHLAEGALGERLPGWLWDARDDGSWGLVDENPASDADLWMAYALLEAERLWNEPQYGKLGRRLLARIAEQEVRDIPGLGPTLIPAPYGFDLGDDRWRLNPSYAPLPLLTGLETHKTAGPWSELRRSTVRMLRDGAPHGFAPDWILYDGERGFEPDPVSGRIGSHDAIRTYLWAGLMHDDAEHKGTVSLRLAGMLRHWRVTGVVPERVDPWSGQVIAEGGPVGFLAVLLPEVIAMADPDELGHLVAQLGGHAHGGLFGDPPTYYDQNLLLFALGAAEDRYGFRPDGLLDVAWAGGCER